MKDKKIMFGTVLAFIFLASVGFSYAYFSNAITNKDVKDQVVETGTLQLTYTDGPEINIQNMKPGNTITKTITVKNTGSLEAKYNIIWQELTNEITNDEMLIEGTCTSSNGTCESIVSTPITDKNIKTDISIASGITHTYSLTITFKETNASQNYNQGKKFNGVLGIKENRTNQFEEDSWTTIATNVKNNNISAYRIGDTKEVDLGDLGKHKVRIANTSTPSECSTEGFSQTACGFVLEFEDIINLKKMNQVHENIGGYIASSLYNYINVNLYNALPTELQNNLIETTVVSGYGQGDSENFISTDKVYLLAPKEIYGDWSSTDDTALNTTKQLDYYKDKNTTINSYYAAIKNYNENGDTSWWLRTAYNNDQSSFYYISTKGKLSEQGLANGELGVSPAFRIG